jgi:hypothetical protein
VDPTILDKLQLRCCSLNRGAKRKFQANWLSNRSFHCIITGPPFLTGGVVFLLSGVRMIHVNAVWVWSLGLIGIGIAFLLEWPYAKRSAS